MIYSAWYFCNIAKLSIVETAGVLTAAQALGCAETDFSEKKNAVNWLKEYDSLIQSYMIPDLTASLFARDSRKQLDEMQESLEKRQYLYEIKDLLMKLSPDRKRQSLVNLIQNLQDVDYDHVVKYVEAYERNEKIFHEGNIQYLEIDKFFEETFLLSMLRCVCCADVNMVSDLVRGEEQIELVRLALEGSFGQLCWNIAAEIQLRCGVPAYEVIRLLPGNWQERPDMVELIVPFLFPETDGRDSLAEIMEETYQLCRFMEYWNRQVESGNGCWMNPDAAKKDRTRLCIVLWQGILWNLAMDRDPGRCMELLKDNWETPKFYKGGISRQLRLSKQQYWMIPEDTGINREEWIRWFVCSPWQKRTESIRSKGKGKQVTADRAEEELFHEFRGFARNDNGEKVFMAVFLMKRIFTVQGENPDDFYIRLLLHFGDLFSCYGARSTFRQVTSPPTDGIHATAWALPIRALGYLANGMLKKIGEGLVNPFVPEKIISHIGRKSPVVCKRDKYNNEQLDYLYNSGAFLTAAYWAYESLSTTGISQDRGENAWLKNGNESSAARLCRWIFGYLPQQAWNEREIIQLDVQAFHAEYSKPENRNPVWLKNAVSGKLKKVSFSQLILCRKLTFKEWCDVGSITRKIFGKDTYLIAHTLRIRALLESQHPATEHAWISEWKNAVSDISYKWEFSRMARYIMAQMFTIVPGNPDNIEVLVELLKKIIHMVHVFASLDSIYYVGNLSENLIELSDRLGEETGEELRGLNAVELFCNIENSRATPDHIYIWKDIFYYYLLAVSGGTQIASERYAGKQLIQYWESKKVHRRHLRTELVELDDWNGWTDRMWLAKDGKLFVVRDCLDIPKDTTVGIIAESKKANDETYRYVIYSGGEEKKFEGIWQAYRKGDIVEVEVNNSHRIERFSAVMWKPVKGERLKAKFEITGDKIEVLVMGRHYEWQHKDAPELFALWNGDFSELFSQGHHLKGTAVVEYAEYGARKWGWVPVTDRYPEFLVKKMFLPKNSEKICTLTFLGETENETELLFSARAGENYVLKAENWTQNSWEQIENELLGGDNRKGIRLNVCLENVDKFPRLKLDGQKPWDYRNVRWREQFAEERPFQIWNEGGKWFAKTDVEEIREKVVVHVKNRKENLDQDRRYNVQVTENGWEECNQRKGYLEVEELKSRILDYTAVTYKELKKLIQIKAGDVFKMRSIRLKRQKNGYYLAELDNGMTVFCAAESFSMLSDSQDMRFWNNRLCMVENIREMKNFKEEHKGKPCNLAELQGKQGKYKGVVAEFTTAINTRTEYAETLELKVFMDVDGQKVITNVPIFAFSPKPQHLGDRVEAEYTEDGWIFWAQCRTVNVRALWQLEDHRGQKEAQIFGASLGLTNISRIGSCMTTQDENRPVLHVWDSDADFQNVFTMQCGIQPGNGKIRKVERRYSDRQKFHWAYQTEIVELQYGGNIFIGEAKAGSFSEPSKGWKVKAEIYRVYDSQSGDLYDLRRCFIPISTDGNQKSLSKERNEEHSIYFQEWLEEGGHHSAGQIKEMLGSVTIIELKELYVPSIISGYDPEGEWINEIPLEEGQRPLVLGRQYAADDIRVNLKNRDGKYIASINDAEPMLLDGKLIAHFDAVNGYTVRKKFYFAGRDDQGRLLFEWGYGYYFAADMQDVTDMNGNLIGNELFFGDRIDAFTFQFDVNGRYHWKARTLLEDIHNEVEGRVWQDAEKGIVQLLKVKTDPEDGGVKICEVSVAGRKIRDSGRQGNGWQFKKIRNARLKRESVQTFVSRMETDEEEIIFAYLNQKDYGKDSSGLEFLYIPLAGSDEQLEILNNKIVCLTAGKITSTDMGNRSSKIVNDQKIDFYLPNELPDDCDNPHLTVSVMRRNFSLDESRLRVYLQSNPKAYYGNNMLVRLKEVTSRRNRAWSGSVRDTPFRSNDNLNAWLGSQKHVIVTMGTLERDRRQLKCAEIAPGIICDITEFCGEMKFDDGAVASLTLVEEKPRPEVVLPGDVQYVPAGGRPVELLIMDGVLKRYVQTVGMDADIARLTLMSSGGHFTIAGFPQIRLQNMELLNQMIKMEPPRLGVLSKNRKGELRVESGGKVRAGYLEIFEESGMPVLNMVSPEGYAIFTSWDQITFKDETPEEIIKHVQQGVWHYHDRTTAVCKENEKRMQIISLPDGRNYKEILVFTDEEQRLRYQRQEFKKYGMSAREIVENGLPEADKWYPVAGTTDHSFWVELFPGKIVELPTAYLFTGKEKSSLSQLYAGVFAAGDEIRLNEEKAPAGGRGKILLHGFKFGARSAFGCGKVFLPIQAEGEDSVCLGGGFWKMKYPLDMQKGLNFESRLVMLDRYNKLSSVKSAEQMMRNDCVFLSSDERGRLCVAGGVDIKVEFADEKYWGEMVWLLRALERNMSNVFRMFKNYLPVVIVGKNQPGTKIWVAYKQQECQGMGENVTLCCNCIGMMQDSEEREQVVLRSGGYIFCVGEDEFIKGISRRVSKYVVRYLSDRKTDFFMTKDNGKWKCGLNIPDNPDKMEVHLLYPIVEENGILCRSRTNLSLHWLPIFRACRVRDVETDKAWGVLSEERSRTARLMEDGMLSLIHEQDNDRRFRLLDMQSSKERVVPKAELKRDEGYYYYLSELYPAGDLLLLKSENRQNCNQDEPVCINILKKKEDYVVTVPRGQRRHKLYLSPWIAEAYREAYSSEEGNGYLDFDLFQDNIPKRFDGYRDVLKQAKEDAASWEAGGCMLRDWERLEDRLVYLYEMLKYAGAANSAISKHTVYLEVYGAVKEWLNQGGEFLACGFCDGGSHRGEGTLDLLPAIAAVLLLNKIDFYDSMLGKEFAVHLARMLGYASGNSLHQEALLKLWFLEGKKQFGEMSRGK